MEADELRITLGHRRRSEEGLRLERSLGLEGLPLPVEGRMALAGAHGRRQLAAGRCGVQTRELACLLLAYQGPLPQAELWLRGSAKHLVGDEVALQARRLC